MSEYTAIKEECYEANLLLPKYHLIDLTFGNVSVADPARAVFAIKPSGVDYAKMTAADMVVVDYEGAIIEGTLRPSSDTPTHRRLYRAFAGIRAVVHTHSRNATAFAQAGRGIPCLGTTHSDYFHGEVPVTRAMTVDEVEGDYEWETGNVIVETMQGVDPVAMPAILVQEHGPFTWGKDAAEAVYHAAVLEEAAMMAWHTLSLAPDAHLNPVLMDKHYLRKHGKNAYYGQGKH